MSICVEIEIDDDGNVQVGICPPDEESGEDKSYMHSAESVEVALAKAKAYLSGKAPATSKPKDMQEAMFGPDKSEPDSKAAKKA